MKRSVLFLLLLLFAMPAIAQEDPTPLNVYNGPIPEGKNVYFVAPEGDDEAPGTEEEPWASLAFAVTQVSRGEVIVMRGGIYEHDETIRIQTPSGYVGEMITVVAYPGEVPILDFSSQPKVRDVHGIRLNANWWHIIGITLRYASHNGIRIDGSYNILEQVTAYGNHDTGIHMAGGASHNLIKNSDSFRNFNYDPARNNNAPIGGNADGFSAKFEIGPGNRYVGCRAWENSDDGWDFWQAANTIVIDSSWAFGNGDASVFGDPAGFNGNGNGFKLGGNFVVAPHIVRRSMAFDNFGTSGNAKGFDYNNNSGAMTLIHNTAFNNGRNYIFPINPPEGQPVFLNNLSVSASVHAQLPSSAIVAGNSWQLDGEVTENLFLSVDTELAKGPRKADGSLPEIDLLVPKSGTYLVDGGVPIGMPFFGAAPDVGVFEVEEGGLTDPWLDRGSGTAIAELRVFDLENAEEWTIEAELMLGGPVFAGSDEILTSLPEGLTVDDWIVPAAASRTTNYLFETAKFILTEDAHVLVAHAEGITPKPDWLSDYIETGAALTLMAGESADHQLRVYQREAAAGDTITLGRNSIDGRHDVPMYLVMVGGPANVAAELDRPIAHASLDPIYPNPVIETATVSFSLPVGSDVSVVVYDALGREVAALADGYHMAGSHAVRWNAAAFSSGVYFCRLQAGSFTATRPIVRP